MGRRREEFERRGEVGREVRKEKELKEVKEAMLRENSVKVFKKRKRKKTLVNVWTFVKGGVLSPYT